MRHPLHPALVHFPVACWTLATLADIAGFWWGETAWRLASFLMAVGTTLAVVAMAAGLVELMKLESGHPALRDVHRHMVLAATAWSFYAASLLLRVDGALAAPGKIAVALGGAGFVALCLTGWMGGKLVYEHGVGVHKRL